MATEEMRKGALALVAVFAAHTFAVVLTEPVEPVVLRVTRWVMAGGMGQAGHVSGSQGTKPGTDLALRSGAEDLGAYEGLGSWIDLFNRGPWRNPSWTVRRMAQRGVQTIYLQTATYGSPHHVVWPRRVAEFIASAHRRDMTVVGWSVPSFTKWGKDLRRARAGLLFETAKGERFDSFALDIEVSVVDSIAKRNARLIKISKKLRRAAGDEFPLGAIVPDAHSRYWPGFPYKALAEHFDVMVPMGYFTFTTRGYKAVRDYTAANIHVIRREAGKEMPIHVIGGIADDVGVPAARGFVRAIKKHRVLGASLYDFPITSDRTWKELSAVGSRR